MSYGTGKKKKKNKWELPIEPGILFIHTGNAACSHIFTMVVADRGNAVKAILLTFSWFFSLGGKCLPVEQFDIEFNHDSLEVSKFYLAK